MKKFLIGVLALASFSTFVSANQGFDIELTLKQDINLKSRLSGNLERPDSPIITYPNTCFIVLKKRAALNAGEVLTGNSIKGRYASASGGYYSQTHIFFEIKGSDQVEKVGCSFDLNFDEHDGVLYPSSEKLIAVLSKYFDVHF